MLAAENWCVKVDDKIYGPYSSQQMRKLAHEGRLAAQSLISPAGSRAWREAREENAFSNFFGYDKNKAHSNNNAPAFGKRDAVETTPANSKTTGAKTTRNATQAPEIRIANFILIFDVVSASASRVEAAVVSLGSAFRIADNVWNVTCELTAVGVRNAIAPYLNPSESIFVIDSTRGRTSWQNYPPEPSAKISAAYLTSKH